MNLNGNIKPKDKHGLTKREHTVLYALSRGYTINEVAEVLMISPKTVHSHSNNCYKKLGVNSLVNAMHKMGWVNLTKWEKK